MATIRQCCEVVVISLILPFYVLGRLATSFFTYERPKTWRAVCTHALFRLAAHSVTFVKLILVETTDTYIKWTNSAGVVPVMEELPDGAKLLWMGPKRLDKVLFYVHGGAFLFGCSPSFMHFFRLLQLELNKRNINIGIVLLAYKLAPDAVFPSQAIAAKNALEHLFRAGVQPQNLLIAGDSAGGNLVLQILQHIIDPRPTIPPLTVTPTSKFLGVLLISPWICLDGAESFKVSDKYDLISARTYHYLGSQILCDVPEGDKAFIDPVGFGGRPFMIDTLAHKVLVTSGEKECMHPTHKLLVEKYLKGDVHFAVTKGVNGIHDDMLFDFVIPGEKEERLSPTTWVIIDWCARLFGEKG
ncbi:Alpha/Beta hydrolase protein [Desarmillaria tabescens]|uniref:Alpha/Beta hydrolase protein n=1 Tax=Armillaria tabescens TaxID=1929756 RepID=A0AA39NB45_ARMTA|nr:Alpha/Beta hydrolase protein [Desarmillaria tabescens]KAK0462367.1 Alpha/Beta hydrolase protein [Desarmillaria tabescens]